MSRVLCCDVAWHVTARGRAHHVREPAYSRLFVPGFRKSWAGLRQGLGSGLGSRFSITAPRRPRQIFSTSSAISRLSLLRYLTAPDALFCAGDAQLFGRRALASR